MNRNVTARRCIASFLLSFGVAVLCPAFAQDYDIVIANGRVMDKEVGKAAELYLRGGNAEHEHSVLVKALADLQRSGNS